jgi:hypothetical protein
MSEDSVKKKTFSCRVFDLAFLVDIFHSVASMVLIVNTASPAQMKQQQWVRIMFLTDLISLYSTNIIVWEGPSHESSGFPPLDFLDIVIVAHTILFIFYDI